MRDLNTNDLPALFRRIRSEIPTKTSQLENDSGFSAGGGGGSYVLPTASAATLGGVKVGKNLKIAADGTLSVDTATAVEQDNTKPVTAAAVYTEIGNISALLETI